MRKTLQILSVAAAAAFATPALAQPYSGYGYAAPVLGAGAVVGTVVGVGTYNGWWGSTVADTALPTTAAGSAAVGLVAGIGTITMIDAFVQPCRGFQAMFMVNQGACENGEYVGYAPRPVSYGRGRR
jgi:hypothetical protein